MNIKPLPRSTPEEQGIPTSAIVEFARALENEIDAVHSFMLVRHGFVVAEAWWKPYSADRPHEMYSVSKSFTSTAVGIAISEGLLSLDDRVVDLLPDDVPDEISANLAALRVRHLLTMTTGHATDAADRSDPLAIDNWVHEILSLPIEFEPGSTFVYNSGASYLLSAILQGLTGERLLDYLTPRILEPLGISNATWEQCPRGIDCGGWGLNITTEDLAAFGQLYLQRGLWNGVQLVPAEWVDEATAYQVDNSRVVDADPEGKLGYGYQFWRTSNGGYRADGAFGQLAIVYPKQDAVLAITSGVPATKPLFDLIWKHISPALGSAVLPAVEAADFSALTLKPQAGAKASTVPAGTFTLDENSAGFESVALSPASLSFTVNGVEHTVNYGHGEWVIGTTALRGWPEPVASSGAWTSESTFVAQLILVESPFTLTATLEFEADAVSLTVAQNVSFLDPQWVSTNGRRA